MVTIFMTIFDLFSGIKKGRAFVKALPYNIGSVVEFLMFNM